MTLRRPSALSAATAFRRRDRRQCAPRDDAASSTWSPWKHVGCWRPGRSWWAFSRTVTRCCRMVTCGMWRRRICVSIPRQSEHRSEYVEWHSPHAQRVGHLFGNGNDMVVQPGFLGLGDRSSQVMMRFSETLPDDLYRIEILGIGTTPLRNTSGEPFQDGQECHDRFPSGSGAQVVAVVPQPIAAECATAP